MIRFALKSTPAPPSREMSKYCPSVYPVPGLAITTLSINPPTVLEESNVRGEAPLSNWITVPAASVAFTGLLRETVVNPPTVTTPLILVFAWIPAVSATTAWPIKAFWL